MSVIAIGLACSLIEKQDLPIAIHIVVESKLFAILHFPLGEDAHAKPSTYNPFGNVAVWVARMIEKATLATFLCCIDKLCDRS